MPDCPKCGFNMAYIYSSDSPYWLCGRCKTIKYPTYQEAMAKEYEGCSLICEYNNY